MMVDREPFKDERVREAFRLMPDRAQMVDLALAGYGRAGQRHVLPLRSRLPRRPFPAGAGHREGQGAAQGGRQGGHAVELITSPMDDGLVEAAQVFAEHAEGAGVKVTVKKVDEATYWDQYYMNTAFTNEYWSTRNYLFQANLCTGAKAQWDVTKWHDDEWQKLVDEAWKTVDEAKRNDLITQAMTIEYERGTYIVPYFKDMLDGHSEKVVGLRSEKGGSPLNDFRYQLLSFA